MNVVKVDKGWSWVVLAGSTFGIVVYGILVFGSGVIHVALLEKFKENDAYTSLIGSINMSMLGLVAPIGGALVNVYSCRATVMAGGFVIFIGYGLSAFATAKLDYLLVTYGLIGGFGLGIAVPTLITSVGFYFRQYYGLSMGILMSGSGVGTLITGPVVQYFLNHYGLEGTFLMLAAIGSHFIIAGALMRPSEIETANHSHTRSVRYNFKDIFHTEILLDKKFIMSSLQCFLWLISYVVIMLHLINFSVVNGTPKESSVLLMTYIGISTLIGRILTGVILNLEVTDVFTLNFGFNGILGVATFVLPSLAKRFIGQIVYASVFGLYSGGLNVLSSPLCMEILDVDKLASGIGILFFIGGLGSLSGPPLIGFINDRTGSYSDGIFCSGGLFMLAAFCTLGIVSVGVPGRGQTPHKSVPSSDDIHFQSFNIKNDQVIDGKDEKDENVLDEKTPFTLKDEAM